MISNEARLGEVLRMAALAINELYKELDRSPPQEAVRLVRELQEYAEQISN